MISWLRSGELPKGCYGRFEAPSASFGRPKGGLVIIMVVRYTDTPCGMRTFILIGVLQCWLAF